FFYYFGEKPLMLSQSNFKQRDFDILKNTPHWCNFIEAKNPIYPAAVQYVEENKIMIKSIRFLRYGYVGLIHLTSPQSRQGITGGSFLDKTIHDLPLTIALLKSSFTQWDHTRLRPLNIK